MDAKYRDAAMFLTLAFFWGSSFPAIEVGLEDLPPLLFAAFRFDVAAVLLLGYAAATGADWRPRTRLDLLAIVAGGVLFIAVGNGMGFVGQLYITAGLAAILFSLVPLLTVGFSWLLLPSERPSALGIAGLLLALVGVVVLVQPDPNNLLTPDFVGVLVVLSAVVGSALGGVTIRRWPATLPPLSSTAWSMVLGAVLLHAGSLAVGTGLGDVALTTDGLLALVYLGLLSSAVAYGIYFTMLRRVTAFEMSLVSYVVPIVASVGGWLLLGEQITRAMVVGFAIIAAGFLVLKRRAFVHELRRVGAVGDAD